MVGSRDELGQLAESFNRMAAQLRETMSKLEALNKNLAGLRLPQVGVSRADFSAPGDEYFEKHLKGVALTVVP